MKEGGHLWKRWSSFFSLALQVLVGAQEVIHGRRSTVPLYGRHRTVGTASSVWLFPGRQAKEEGCISPSMGPKGLAGLAEASHGKELQLLNLVPQALSDPGKSSCER